MKFEKLEIILSIIGGFCLLSAIPLVICMNHTTPRGDSANWLQAIVAILTLLGVIYAAIKSPIRKFFNRDNALLSVV
ncbi:hypothetical protein HLH33_20035 [Gluconacetobacter diazotrophicus]|uniref:Uncharacterized protein n=1 Tax=Gluconacetobacter diazotrophicus TaxID=33996 RepID=A0A7W4NIT4_GLUDI|nr:hypothetical protein [Gluconacetobacter diazotrophicus]